MRVSPRRHQQHDGIDDDGRALGLPAGPPREEGGGGTGGAQDARALGAQGEGEGVVAAVAEVGPPEVGEFLPREGVEAGALERAVDEILSRPPAHGEAVVAEVPQLGDVVGGVPGPQARRVQDGEAAGAVVRPARVAEGDLGGLRPAREGGLAQDRVRRRASQVRLDDCVAAREVGDGVRGHGRGRGRRSRPLSGPWKCGAGPGTTRRHCPGGGVSPRE